ncbi:hypothetical protein GJAV_G00008940 [Gymnothorax javanicus]|nr:hypothetical protein GJAV_G00008940 [Gymnothorax javanicus]
MNTPHNKSVYSFFSDDNDALVIEDAIRAAINEVIDVFLRINNKKIQDYEMRLTEKDRENELLRTRMEIAERELVTLRRRQINHPMGYRGNSVSPDPDADDTLGGNSCLSTEENRTQRVCVVPFPIEKSEVLSECAFKREDTTGLYEMYSNADPHQGEACIWESSVAMNLSHVVQNERTANPITEEGQLGGRAECGSTLSISTVKEEPPDFQSIHVEWEMSDETVTGVGCDAHRGPPPCAALSQCRRGKSLAPGAQDTSVVHLQQPEEGISASATCERKRLLNREKQQKYRERIRADPERERAYRERDRNRQRIRRKRISELSEDYQKLRREAEREATRRHRERKKNSAS